MPELRRGDVVLVGFPFVAARHLQRKTRPAVVVQADRYNRRRSAVILAAITSSQAHHDLPCKVPITKASAAGRAAGLRIDSVIDCQTLVTIPSDEIVRKLGAFPRAILERIDHALVDAIGLPASPGGSPARSG